MEDHREAYFFWRKLGVLEASCVHVDAHLDTCEFQLPGTTGIHRPEINCGNYLLQAMAEGIVQTLVWVVPSHLLQPDPLAWVRQEVPAWLHPSLSEYLSWHQVGSRVEGQLRGCRFIVCRSDQLPALEGPVLLDIDVDYFLGPGDEVWQSPLELAGHLGRLSPVALTVAYSIEGGYTPLWLRYLGDLTLLAWQQPEEAARAAIKLQEGATDAPGWVRAARLVARARDNFADPAYLRAAESEPGYHLSALDAACFHLQRKRFDASLSWLERAGLEDPKAAAYLRAFVHFSQQDHCGACALWQSLLDEFSDDGSGRQGSTRRHLLEMQGRSLAALGRPEEAVESFTEAARLSPREVNLWLELARAQVAAGQCEAAARSYRRGISLGPDLMISLQAQLELVQLYFQLGQPSLAQAQKQRLLQKRLPPALRLQAFGLGLRAARAR
jgi:tetratricopeptide (TPR) repeat protein